MKVKTLLKKYQKEIWVCIIILFFFIVYRRCVINRLYYGSFQEGLSINQIQKKNKSLVRKAANKQSKGKPAAKLGGRPGAKLGGRGGNIVAQTGKKIEIIQKRGKGQDKKMKDMQVTIDHVNKELNKKLNGED